MASAPRRVLVVRGGAIGDLVLTLPALRGFRALWPGAEFVLAGQRDPASLVVGRGYFHDFIWQESADFVRWVASERLRDRRQEDLLAGCDAVISYRPDPEGKFLARLRQAGFCSVWSGPARPEAEHAIDALARPLLEAGGRLVESYARLFPGPDDLACAARQWPRQRPRRIAVHPGSGSRNKNCSLAFWQELLERLSREEAVEVVLLGGEADGAVLRGLASYLGRCSHHVVGAPLPEVAGMLAQCDLMVGHDSGPTHIAAAVGCPVLALFISTDPEIWAPRHPATRWLDGRGRDLSADHVWDRMAGVLG